MSNPIENSTLKDKITGSALFKGKRGKIYFILITLFLIIGVAVYFYVQSLKYVSTEDAFIEGDIVQISPKVSGIISKVNITDNQFVKKGQLLFQIDPRDYQTQLNSARASLNSAIYSQKQSVINKYITSVTSNALVKQASSGVEFSNAGIQLAKQQSLIAKIGINSALENYKASQNVVAQGKAQVQSDSSRLRLAEADLHRYKGLYEMGAISKQQYDDAVTDFQVSRSDLEQDIKKIDTSINKMNADREAYNASVIAYRQSKDQIAQSYASQGESVGKLNQVNTVPQNITLSQLQEQSAIAEIKRLQANLKQAQLNLSYTKIYAPINGRIARRNVRKGAYIAVGQGALALVPQDVWVVANFKETQLEHMKVGQKAFIKVDTYPDKEFEGKVNSFQHGTGSKFSLFPPENAVGSFVKVVQRLPVKITFDDKTYNSKYILVPGMSVEPKVKIK